MKNKSLLLLIAGLLLLGSVFTASAQTIETVQLPVLTDLIAVTNANGIAGKWTPATSFTKGTRSSNGLNIGIRGENPGRNITKFDFTIKEGDTVINSGIMDVNINRTPFTHFFGSFTFSNAGTYTVEICVIDANGNKSNVKYVTVTIR